MVKRVFALSDLHVGHAGNRESLERLEPHPDDWLLVAGDVGESVGQLEATLASLVPRFERVVWVPGNHELWSSDGLVGVAKYEALVSAARALGVLTPEDPFEVFPGSDLVVAPLFLLYDYSFCPDGLDPEAAVRWAAEGGIICADEQRLVPTPFPSRQAWCADRVRLSEARLSALDGAKTLLVAHWPFREDLVRLFRIPRFVPWCGTRQTADWHVRFNAAVVVTGHLHMRATDWRDGVRFEEVSLGYPRHYDPERGAPGYMRQVWPPVAPDPPSGFGGPIWHR